MDSDLPPGDPTPSAAPFPVTPVHPDLLAYARQTFDIVAFQAEVQDVLANGGHTFEEVMAAVEAAMRDEAGL